MTDIIVGVTEYESRYYKVVEDASYKKLGTPAPEDRYYVKGMGRMHGPYKLVPAVALAVRRSVELEARA